MRKKAEHPSFVDADHVGGWRHPGEAQMKASVGWIDGLGQAPRQGNPIMRIGIISDTHGLLRPEAIKHLAGTDHIIHAGDIGAPEVIEGLRRIAPTTAIRGNIDVAEWAKGYPYTKLVVLGGRAFYVLHNLKEIKLDPAASGFDVVISGHSHRPKIETKKGVLYVNPGSAGPRRFKLPVAVATVTLSDRAILPRILEIAP